MILLHRIGPRVNSNFNTLDEILALPKDTPISFDGIYQEVFDNRRALSEMQDVTLFVMGKYVGCDNSFDVGQPQGTYLTWPVILHLHEAYGWKLGYHSWSHRDMTTLSVVDMVYESTPPIPMKYFAYPGGAVNEKVAQVMKNIGYEEAWSVTQGDDSQYQRKRKYLNW